MRNCASERAGWVERSDTHHVLDNGDGFRGRAQPILRSWLRSPDPRALKVDLPVVPIGRGVSSLIPDPNQQYIPHRLAPSKGAYRDRHERGAGCGGRWTRDRRARVSRTVKSCGSGVPTLMPRSWI